MKLTGKPDILVEYKDLMAPLVVEVNPRTNVHFVQKYPIPICNAHFVRTQKVLFGLSSYLICSLIWWPSAWEAR